MNKYILSALVVPVAFMGTTAAQAKTAALKARVNHVHASAKKITGKTVRGAHIKLTRGTVTYGVAQADRHGHFVLKLKHKIKGGWKYQVSISKAGYKTKSIGFKVKGLTKKAAKIKPVVSTPPAPTTPTTPAAPQAPAAQSSVPKPTTVGSQADVEADKVSNDIARLNLQMDNFQAGRQTMTPFWRTSIASQLQQLLNRINGLVTGNLRTDLLNTLRNAWTNLHQRFLNFVAGLNRQVFGGSTPAKSVNPTAVQKTINRADPTAVANEIKQLQCQNKEKSDFVSNTTKDLAQMKENFEQKKSHEYLQLDSLKKERQVLIENYQSEATCKPDDKAYNDLQVAQTNYNRQLKTIENDEAAHQKELTKRQKDSDTAREQISKNNIEIQILQDLQKQASQTK